MKNLMRAFRVAAISFGINFSFLTIVYVAYVLYQGQPLTKKELLFPATPALVLFAANFLYFGFLIKLSRWQVWLAIFIAVLLFGVSGLDSGRMNPEAVYRHYCVFLSLMCAFVLDAYYRSFGRDKRQEWLSGKT